MIAAPALFPASIESPVAAALARSGFSVDGEGWTRGDLRFRQAGRWSWLEQSLDTEPTADLGKPGLWRTVTAGGRALRIFEIPDTVLALADDGFTGDEVDPFTACLVWALTTATGKIPDGWQPETRESMEILVPKNRLTVLAGASLRQGELFHTEQCLALRFPIVHAIPANLPASRLAHLHALLRDTQNGWSLIRLGLGGPSSVLAEIDLTGAPAAALEPLISTALDSLHNVIWQLVGTTEVLMDAEVASVALDTVAVQTSTNKDHQNDSNC